ncbi:hemagglutinin repeat-containing protein [Comamonas sp. C24C]
MAGTVVNSGTLQSAGTVAVDAGSVNNMGTLIAAADLTATTMGNFTNVGTVQASGGLGVSSDGQFNNMRTGVLKAATLNLAASKGLDNAGIATADKGDATLRVDGTLANSGQLQAKESIDIADGNGNGTQAVVNSGKLLAGQAQALEAASFGNTATGTTQAVSGSRIAVGSLDNQGTWLLSQQNTATDTVTVTGTLTNGGTLQSAGNETIGAHQLTNTGKLIALGDLTANVETDLSNNGTTAAIQAGNHLSVQGTGAALTTTVGSKLLGDGLTIKVASIDNAGTLQGGMRANSTVSAVNMLNNRSSGVVTVTTDATGAGTVAATTITNDGKLQSSGALTLAVGTGGLTSNGTLIAKRNLTMQDRSGNAYTANVNGLMQSRNGTLEVIGTPASTLSIGTAGTVVGQTLTGTLGTISLGDGATLSSDRGMTLMLGTLTLGGSKAAVLGSTDQGNPSLTSITTTSALTNNGLLFSGHHLKVNAPSLGNGLTGGISALYDLTVSATAGNLTNQGTLYAGNALNASASGMLTNAATLTAYQGTISAGQSVSLNADTLVNNSTIDSNGSITLSARNLSNEVLGGDTRKYDDESARVKTQTGYDSQGYNGHGCCDQYESWHYKETWYKDQTYFGGTPTVKPQITATGAVNLLFSTGKNLGGVISGDTVTFSGSGGTFANDDLALQRTSYTRTWTEETKYIAAGPLTYYKRSVINDGTTKAVTEISNIGAGVFARVLTGSNFALTNNGSIAATADMKKGDAKTATVKPKDGDDATKGTVGSEATGTTTGTVTPVTTLNGRPAIFFVAVNAANGVTGTSFGGINIPLPTNPNGLYVTALEPGANYLVESNPRYHIGSSTVSSDYLAERLGYDVDTLVRRLGDSSYEAYLIKQQLIAQMRTSLLAGVKDEGVQVQGLLDSAVSESKSLGLVYGQALTPEQQSKLTHDIVWMVQTEIDGRVVLAPVVYLSPQTKAGVMQGAVITVENANLSLTSLTNTGGTIAGKKALNVVSVGDVTNTSGTIKGGNVSITSTGGSIINKTTASGSGVDQRYATDIGKTASIESTDMLLLNAAKDITNTGANVAADGDAGLKAGGNVTFDTIQNKTAATTHSSYNSAFRSGSTTTTTTTVDQVKSGLTSGGDLSINAGKNITLAGTDAKAAGSADLKAGGDLNILARENKSDIHSVNTASGLGMNDSLYGSTTITTHTGSVRNVGSTLQVGGSNASLNAKNDLTVKGSSIDVKGNGNISATNINLLAGHDYDETHTTTESIKLLQVSASSAGSTKTEVSASANASADNGNYSASVQAGASASATGTASAGLALMSVTKIQADTTDLHHVGSSVKFGGDAAIKAKNVGLQGSKVAIDGNAVIDVNSIELLAAEDKKTSTTSTENLTIGIMASSTNSAEAEISAEASAAVGAKVNPTAKVGINARVGLSSDSRLDYLQHRTNTTSTLETNHQGSSISAGDDLRIVNADTLKLEGSTLAAKNNVNIEAKEQSYTAVNDVRETRSSSSLTTAGLYVDGKASGKANAGAALGLGASANASVQGQARAESGYYVSNTRTDSADGTTAAVTSGLVAGGNITRTATERIDDVGTQIDAGGDFAQSAKTITSRAAADKTYSTSGTQTDTMKLGQYAEATAAASVGLSGSEKSASVGAGLTASYVHEDEAGSSNGSRAVVSTIKAGGNANSQSSGATDFEGTSISAGKNVSLDADSLNYRAAHNTASSHNDSTTAGGVVDLDFLGPSVNLSVNYHGNKESDSSSQAIAGGIVAGGNLSINTKGDSRFEGTHLAADGKATLNAGGKLLFGAATNHEKSSKQGVGVDVGVSAGTKGGGVNANAQVQIGSSSRDTEIGASVRSGKGSIDIHSGGDATFVGTSFDAGKNDVTLVSQGDLQFKAAHDRQKSTSVEVSVGLSVSGGKNKGASKFAGMSQNLSSSGTPNAAFGLDISNSDTVTGTVIKSGGKVILSARSDLKQENVQVVDATSVHESAGGKSEKITTQSTSDRIGIKAYMPEIKLHDKKPDAKRGGASVDSPELKNRQTDNSQEKVSSSKGFNPPLDLGDGRKGYPLSPVDPPSGRKIGMLGTDARPLPQTSGQDSERAPQSGRATHSTPVSGAPTKIDAQLKAGAKAEQNQPAELPGKVLSKENHAPQLQSGRQLKPVNYENVSSNLQTKAPSNELNPPSGRDSGVLSADSSLLTPDFEKNRSLLNSEDASKSSSSELKTFSYKNVDIKSRGPNASTVLILGHGGHTPSRNIFMPGSGKVKVPDGKVVNFNSLDGNVSIGTKADHLLQGFSVPPIDSSDSGTTIKNYSFEHAPVFDHYKPTDKFDLITIQPGKKAHMRDVFDALKASGSNCTTIHNFACRINKQTYTGTISSVGSPSTNEKNQQKGSSQEKVSSNKNFKPPRDLGDGRKGYPLSPIDPPSGRDIGTVGPASGNVNQLPALPPRPAMPPRPKPVEDLLAEKLINHFGMEAGQYLPNPSPKLTDGEAMSIGLYTNGEYRKLNEELREKKERPDHRKAVDEGLQSGIPKLSNGTIVKSYRGGLAPAGQSIVEGTEISDPGYFSTSKDPKIAESFEKSPQTKKFIIFGESGADVSGISMEDYEKEVLYPKDTRFNPLFITPDGKNVVLEEAGLPPKSGHKYELDLIGSADKGHESKLPTNTGQKLPVPPQPDHLKRPAVPSMGDRTGGGVLELETDDNSQEKVSSSKSFNSPRDLGDGRKGYPLSPIDPPSGRDIGTLGPDGRPLQSKLTMDDMPGGGQSEQASFSISSDSEVGTSSMQATSHVRLSSPSAGKGSGDAGASEKKPDILSFNEGPEKESLLVTGPDSGNANQPPSLLPRSVGGDPFGIKDSSRSSFQINSPVVYKENVFGKDSILFYDPNMHTLKIRVHGAPFQSMGAKDAGKFVDKIESTLAEHGAVLPGAIKRIDLESCFGACGGFFSQAQAISNITELPVFAKKGMFNPILNNKLKKIKPNKSKFARSISIGGNKVLGRMMTAVRPGRAPTLSTGLERGSEDVVRNLNAGNININNSSENIDKNGEGADLKLDDVNSTSIATRK